MLKSNLTPQPEVKSGLRFELIQDMMVALLIHRKKKNGSKMKLVVLPQRLISIFKQEKAANSAVSCTIWSNFELIEILWLPLLPARMKKIH